MRDEDKRRTRCGTAISSALNSDRREGTSDHGIQSSSEYCHTPWRRSTVEEERKAERNENIQVDGNVHMHVAVF